MKSADTPMFLLIAALAGGSGPMARAENCAAAEAALRAELVAGRYEPARSALSTVDAVCPPARVRDQARYVDEVLVAAAARDRREGHPEAARRRLEQAPGVSWTVPAAWGDLAAAAKDWRAAKTHYLSALQRMNEPDFAQSYGPGWERKREQVLRLAADAQLLDGRVEGGATRGGGGGGGLLTAASRGFANRPVPEPVRFRYKEAALDADGQAAARRIAAELRSLPGLRRVTVIGHADPVGGDGYNLGLSQRRAAALAAALRTEGLAVPLDTRGLGERQPPPNTDLENLTQEERHALWRRVEFLLDTTPGAAP